MTSKRILWVALLGGLTVSFPVIAVLIIFRDKLLFDPKVFINEWFKLLVSLVSLFISFMLGQVYWEKHQSKQKRTIIFNSLLKYLSRLYSITNDSRNLINREFTSEQYDEIDLIDARFLDNLRQLVVLRDSYFQMYSDVEILRLSDMLDLYLYQIAPLINQLSSYCDVQSVQGDVHKIREILKNLEENCIMAIDLLNKYLENENEH